ncbi:PP2C family protein-serine/threonine phosphatase [Nocardioides rubriscoriae]|uniref:PP2C family protein-serine/threonine phosphatase n=1 Tax=Nocardioides rubriscoriae TaxID=642762 RepID=UPI0011DFC6F5|nr:SpoIIE family protein phosphatase [Nocardioides rubriscoriae]
MTSGARTEAVERHRQRAVESLQLLDDPQTERFDRLTRMARTMFGVPLSTITVLDGDRAWFPGSAGLDVTEAPRNETFCDRTTAEDQLILVEDATQDERFKDLPAVRAGAIRFYAGQPLHDPAGHVIGTFCLYDSRPRTLEGDLLVAFLDLACWAQQELTASSEMRQAGQVQASMLPAHPIRAHGWEIAGACVPALAVGGDFYDHGLAGDVAHLSLADVMGKGTGAALVGAGVRAALRATDDEVAGGADLGATTTRVARSLISDLERATSFVTLFRAVLDLRDGTVRYVDAGSGLCLLVEPDGTTRRLSSRDRPFGILDDDSWTEHTATMAPGARLLVLSDGVLDLLDDPLTWWEPLAELVRAARDTTDLLAALARLSRDGVPLDDVTAVAVFRGTEGGR